MKLRSGSGTCNMRTAEGSDDVLETAQYRISWVLDHPGMSEWLKEAVRTALDRDPVAVLNDLELLNTLLRLRAEAQINAVMPKRA